MSNLNISPIGVLTSNGIKFSISDDCMVFTREAVTLRYPMDHLTDALRLQEAVKGLVPAKYRHAVVVPYMEHMQAQSFDDAWELRAWFDDTKGEKPQPTEKIWPGTGIPVLTAMRQDGTDFKTFNMNAPVYLHFIGPKMMMNLFKAKNPMFAVTDCAAGDCAYSDEKGAHSHAVYGNYRTTWKKQVRQLIGKSEDGKNLWGTSIEEHHLAPPIRLPYATLQITEACTLKARTEFSVRKVTQMVKAQEQNVQEDKEPVEEEPEGDDDTCEEGAEKTNFDSVREAYAVLMKSDFVRWAAIIRDVRNSKWITQPKFSASVKTSVNVEFGQYKAKIAKGGVTAAALAKQIFDKHSKGGDSDRMLSYFAKRVGVADSGIKEIDGATGTELYLV